MEAESLAEEYLLTWKGHIQYVQDSFTRLLQRNEFCDVTLYAEGQKIGAHKVFLTACSGYFNELFEDLKDERTIVVLKGVKFDILRQILRFIYNGQVSIEMEKLNAFLEAAEFLKISGLMKDNIVRKRTCSLASDSDDEHTCSLVKEKSVEDSTVSEVECQDSLECTENEHEHGLLGRLLETKEYGFFKKKSSEPLQLSKASSQHRSDLSDKNSPNAEPVNEKYTLESPKRTNEWTSDYENNGQSDEVVEQSPQENVEDPQTQLDGTVKRKRIKLERLSSDLEGLKEIESIDERDFANSLDAEIDFTDDEDDSLEKEMLKTSLAGISEDGFQCNICNKTYVKKDSLKKHFAVHTKNTGCMICGLTLSRRTHLKRHMKVHGISGQ